ncbi:DNA-binding protein [Lentilactobacillus curieae]|uniref:DNA-binding protein n=1 Tax=Lentilactobacillus curieae TaxID=1138822 RepID=A0A1S6QH88_9LACO|nr:ribbon-helix-helix protein, CopG family [Lentilactobacillus curieae]AQW20972.1 DNA-binding protein [Lentilactobacillus curieae]
MGISAKKTRTTITLEKEFKEHLQQLADEENRSMNNLIETALKKYVTEHEEESKKSGN